MYANLKHKKGICYFCYKHAQDIQDILEEKGLTIQTEEEAAIMEEKLSKEEALPKDANAEIIRSEDGEFELDIDEKEEKE